MGLLLDLRVWCIALAALAGGYLKGCVDGQQIQQGRTASDISKANVETFRRSEHLQRNADEASTLAAARANDDRNRARSADASLDRLRVTLDAVERAAAASGHASAQTIAALGADLRSCSKEYRLVGEEAAGHASDSLMYQQAWPK